MSVGKMSGFPHARHRLGVLPGLSSQSGTGNGERTGPFASTLATIDDESSNKQLVALSRPQSKMINLKGWTSIKSHNSDESVNYYFQNFSSRISTLEEANKAILEEVYRLQSNVRATEFSKKEMAKDEKRVQRELMDTIRSSNDIVAQLTSRLRKAEEKLHQEKENVKNLMIHSKKLEQMSDEKLLEMTLPLHSVLTIYHQQSPQLKKTIKKTKMLDLVFNITVRELKRKNLQALGSKVDSSTFCLEELVLLTSQKEADSLRDANQVQAGDMKQRMDEMLRRWEKNDRISAGIIDEFHQLKNRVEIQGMEFTHLQTELKQRSKRTEDELKQTMQQARFQQDTNSIAEQNTLQLRHLFEARMSENRDAINELRNRLTQTESNSRSQVQQLTVKLSDIQANITDLSHRSQEELQNLEKSRQEYHHVEENERYKLQNKIQVTFEEINEKLLQKEVRLREEALKKFVDVEKLFQKEETLRLNFEKQLREDMDSRWEMQHKLYVEEMEAFKETRRNEKSQQISNFKKIDDCLVMLDKKIKYERKTLEKVLLAEITKREVQSRQILSQLDGVKEQLRVAISTLQEALSGLQMQTNRQKEELLNEVRKLTQLKTRFIDGQESITRTLRDVDARLTALSTRITQQDETLETRVNTFKQTMQDEYNEHLRSTAAWRNTIEREFSELKKILNEIPQEIKETEERVALLKEDLETRSNLETESRLKESESIKKQTRQLLQRIEELDAETIKEKSRHSHLETEVIAMQGSLGLMEQLTSDVKSNLVSRVNSETKMRLEETSSIKREVARLRVEMQPLFWEHHNKSRNFVKTPVLSLNEWGIYQCARWYDIKMRWLRLLDRSRKRKLGLLKPNFSSTSAVPSNLNIENEHFDGRSSRQSVEAVTDFADGISEGRNEHTRLSPQPAWYNQESVLEDNSEASFDGKKSENDPLNNETVSPNTINPDGHDGLVGDHQQSEKDSIDDLPEQDQKRSFDPSPVKDDEVTSPQIEHSTHDSINENLPEPESQAVVTAEDNNESSYSKPVSSGSNKSGASFKLKSSDVSPSGEQNPIQQSASRRNLKPVQTTSGLGKAYDMEGSK